MEISDYTLIISSIIIVLGWFVNSFLNRRHEISKKRLDYRLEALQSFLPVFLGMETSFSSGFKDVPTLKDKIQTARVNFQLYGYQDEIDLFDKFVSTLEKQDTSGATATINELIQLVRCRLRDELQLPPLRF